MLSLSSLITLQLGVADTRRRALSAKHQAPSSRPLTPFAIASVEKRTLPDLRSTSERNAGVCVAFPLLAPLFGTGEAFGCTWELREQEQPMYSRESVAFTSHRVVSSISWYWTVVRGDTKASESLNRYCVRYYFSPNR